MIFDIKLRGQQLIVPSNIILAAGARNSVSVRIDADEAWDGLTMTLTCRTVYLVGIETHTVAALTPETGVVLPHENMIPGALYLGVTGYGADGAVKLTTAQMVVPIKIYPCEDDTADPSTEITPALGAQILAYIGLIDSLTTDKKNTIVAAINELAAKLSGIVGTFHSALQAYPSTGYTGLPVFESQANGAIISNLSIIRAADEEGVLEVPTRKLVNSMISGVLSYTMQSFERALAAYRDGDTAGLPVMDPDSDTGFSNMILQSSIGEGAGSPYSVPTLGSVKLMLSNALALGYVDVTKDYEHAQGITDLGANPRAFLWSLPPGRYFLCEEDGDLDTRYYLQALAGERPDYIGGWILYTVADFCNIEFYGGNNGRDHTAVPDLEIIGETGEIYRQGKLLEPGGGGEGGKSAYELAVEQGFQGSLTAWLASLVGPPGDPGHTPVKGIDYFTPEEQEQCRQWIAAELAKRGQLRPEFANSVEDCREENKLYVLPDGYLYGYLLTKHVEGGYTNLVGTSKAGFLPGYRMKAITDEPVAVTGEEAATAFVTNIFPCKQGDTIRIRGVGRSETDSATAPVFMVVPVDSTGAVIKNHGFCLSEPAYTGSSLFAAWKQAWNQAVPDENGTIVWKYAINNLGENKADLNLSEATTAVRLSGVALNGFDKVIVTVNEEIVEPFVVNQYAWANTGHPFIPADYEERILALENAVTGMEDIKGRTAELEEDMSAIKEAMSFDGLLNYNIFDYAYIKNGELVANALPVTGNQHGHYTGVKMTGNVKRIMCKAKILPNSSVVLISTKLGSSVVANITRGSLHVIFNSNGCAVGIYDGGTDPLRNVMQYPCPVSADSVVSFGYAVDEAANTMTVYLPDGTTKTLTDNAISVVNGEYAIWEHYCSTSSVEFRSCRIAKLWCSDINGEVLDDDLKRFDGAIGVAPTGQVYRQFRTGQQINRDFK